MIFKYCSWLNSFTFFTDFYLKEEKVCRDIRSRAESTINKVIPNPPGTYEEFVKSPILNVLAFLLPLFISSTKKKCSLVLPKFCF